MKITYGHETQDTMIVHKIYIQQEDEPITYRDEHMWVRDTINYIFTMHFRDAKDVETFPLIQLSTIKYYLILNCTRTLIFIRTDPCPAEPPYGSL